MLQQTQVDRVIPFYTNFLKRFPTVRKLASAPLSDVLKAWQGLGYNRRGIALHKASKEIVSRFQGNIPQDVDALESLPGIGPYTARAILAFAFDQDVIFIETNVRTAVVHHFFPAKRKILDRDIERVLKEASPRGRGREWQSALMDYGASLKRSGVRVNAKSAHYVKQKMFTGSSREARGAILRALSTQPIVTGMKLTKLLGVERKEQIRTALSALCAEGLVEKIPTGYSLAT
jgi:A/G-specific adenine glycosylase